MLQLGAVYADMQNHGNAATEKPHKVVPSLVLHHLAVKELVSSLSRPDLHLCTCRLCMEAA